MNENEVIKTLEGLLRLIKMTHMIVLNHLDDPLRVRLDLERLQEIIDAYLKNYVNTEADPAT